MTEAEIRQKVAAEARRLDEDCEAAGIQEDVVVNLAFAETMEMFSRVRKKLNLPP